MKDSKIRLDIKKVVLYTLEKMGPLSYSELHEILYSMDMVLVEEGHRRLFNSSYTIQGDEIKSREIENAINELKNGEEIIPELDRFAYKGGEVELDDVEAKEYIDDYIDEFKDEPSKEIKKFALDFNISGGLMVEGTIDVDGYLSEVIEYNDSEPPK